MPGPQVSAKHIPDAYCPHCGVNIHPQLVNLDFHIWQQNYADYYLAYCLVRCPRQECGLTFYLTAKGTFSTRDGSLFEIARVAVWPPSKKKIDNRIPEDVGVDFQQAYRCWVMGLVRAGTLALRRCLENACLTAGATEDRLESMIDELADKKVLHPINVQSAHKTRIIGNFTAHLVRDITPEELEKTIILTEKILDDLFVTPALQKEIDTTRPPRT